MEQGWLREVDAAVRQVLAGAARRTVAVLATVAQRPTAEALQAAHPHHRFLLLDARADPDELHLGLAASGPFDLVVDLAPGRGAAARFSLLLYHLAEAGSLVMRRAGPGADELVGLLQEVLALHGSDELHPPNRTKDQRPRRLADRHALAATVGSLDVGNRIVTATSRGGVLAKVPEASGDALLDLAPHRGRTLTTIAPATWRARCSVTGSDPDRLRDLPATYEGTQLSLRLYHDVVCLPQGGVVQSNVVLPDTFRRRWNARTRSASLIDWDRRFAVAPPATPQRLEGSFFHLDNEWRGHFGHALTEQVSKLWAWTEARRADPTVRALVLERPGVPLARWELDLLAAAGIGADDVVVARHPVSVGRLYAATPAYSLPDHLHPVVADTYRAVGAALAGEASRRTWPERVFLSRRRTHERWCHNAAEVEDTMRQHGFEVVYPEDLRIADQVTLVRNAATVAGFAGSGMYQIGFADEPTDVLLISSESYTATVEHKLAALHGHALAIAWCRADVPLSDAFSRAAFKSDFTYDAEREGAFVRSWLAGR